MSKRLEKVGLKLGFIALTDCAPLMVAREQGLFAEQGLDVTLSREASWANIRDKVTSGALDGAHMLAPMAVASSLGADGPRAPMIAPLALNVNGSSIGISIAVAEQLDAGASLKQVIAARTKAGNRPLTFAVVFPYSLHNYMLRYWLAEQGVDPDHDVRITVVPPPRIAARVASGEVDGFCVGAPWGGAVEASGTGRMVLHGAQFWRGAPDKVFGVTAGFAAKEPEILQALLRALVRAALWADDPANGAALLRILSGPAYLDMPAAALGRALAPSNPFGLRFFRDDAAYPKRAHALWLLSQMRRWGQAPTAPDQEAAVEAVYRPDLYRLAAQAVGAPPPSAGIDSASLPPLYDGQVFDAAKLDDYVERFAIRSSASPAQ